MKHKQKTLIPSVRICRLLLPFSWLYGAGVWVRNILFDRGVIKEKRYAVPVVCIGNLTVGGTGKTPHTEYLIRLLSENLGVAVLSRGYKRKSKGFVLASQSSGVEDIGDEPYQMKHKYPFVAVAVDEKRQRGIEMLLSLPQDEPDVILLDDAFQHRYVKPGLNILLTDSNRLISRDYLLPAGRLREYFPSKRRADIIIVTKCKKDAPKAFFAQVEKEIAPEPYQKLFFSYIKYGNLYPLFEEGKADEEVAEKTDVLLLTGIAEPAPMRNHLESMGYGVHQLSFSDHHDFTERDAALLNREFSRLDYRNSIIVTTEKDASRLQALQYIEEQIRSKIYVMPIEIDFLQGKRDVFNDIIETYVGENKRNGSMD